MDLLRTQKPSLPEQSEVRTSVILSMENITVGGMQKRESKGPRQCLEGTTTISQSQRLFLPPSDVSANRRRGRPPGSKNRQKVSLGWNFTPQVIIVNRGEEVLEKISTISQRGSRRANILSANGSLYSVTIHRPGSPNSVQYEGCFSMISLYGSIGITENKGVPSRMSISFGGVDGCVYGGEVAGPLIAASRIQVVVATYTLRRPRKQRKTFVDKSSAITLPSTPNEGTIPTNDFHARGEKETGSTQLPMLLTRA